MPGTVAEALAELAGEDSAVVGGGTSITLLLKSGLLAARRLVYLGRIPELARAGERPDGTIRLGATVTVHQLCRSPLVAAKVRSEPVVIPPVTSKLVAVSVALSASSVPATFRETRSSRAKLELPASKLPSVEILSPLR